jgi:hypothetical protein
LWLPEKGSGCIGRANCDICSGDWEIDVVSQCIGNMRAMVTYLYALLVSKTLSQEGQAQWILLDRHGVEDGGLLEEEAGTSVSSLRD